MKRVCFASVSLFVVLALGCSNERAPSPADTEGVAPATLDATTPPAQTTIIRIENFDRHADGTVDVRTILTTWYDSHGNPVRELYENDPSVPEGHAARATFVAEYSVHGAILDSVFDIDEGADGTIDSRTTLETLETDQKGNPTRQIRTDYGSNGAETGRIELTNVFDSRNRIIAVSDGTTRTDYVYDAHGNVVISGSSSRGTLRESSYEYTIHDALVYMTEQVLDRDDLQSSRTLTTVSQDGQGYPLQQIETFLEPPIHTPQESHPAYHERASRVLTYDGRHNLLSQTDDVDYEANGSVDARSIITWQYAGRGLDTAPSRLAFSTGGAPDRLAAAGPDRDRGSDGGREIQEH
jgi:hypothetical protein